MQEKGFCELLSETQLDNPRLMRPFRNATYYDNIRCRTDEEEDAIVITKPVGAVNEEEKKTETTVAPVDSHIPEGMNFFFKSSFQKKICLQLSQKVFFFYNSSKKALQLFLLSKTRSKTFQKELCSRKNVFFLSHQKLGCGRTHILFYY